MILSYCYSLVIEVHKLNVIIGTGLRNMKGACFQVLTGDCCKYPVHNKTPLHMQATFCFFVLKAHLIIVYRKMSGFVFTNVSACINVFSSGLIL